MNFFKPNWSDYHNIYVSSDFHAYHKNYCEGVSSWSNTDRCRKFVNEYVMTDKLVLNINSTVQPDDLLFHLGDWSFGGIDNITRFYDRLDCKNIVNILGNHDHHIRKHKELQDLFLWVGDYLEVCKRKTTICMCHYPIISWNDANHGCIMLFGHCHGSLPEVSCKMFDVGIDANCFRPVLLDYFIEFAKSRKSIVNDHHGEI